jgi:hypothetical protein
MQKARRQAFPDKSGHSPPTACRHVVSDSFLSPCRGSFHLSLALLGSLSVTREYLALRDGPRGFRPRFTCMVLLRIPLGRFACRLQGFHLLWPPIPERLTRVIRILNAVLQPPRSMLLGFRLIPLRSPLLRESLLLSFPTGTEMFQFPALARALRDQHSFDSFPGIIAVFRALMPSGAKTSPTRPY